MTTLPRADGATIRNTSPRSTERGGIDWLLAVAVLAFAATVVRAMAFTPVEALQGPAQKIFYIHAPSAFVGLYVAFGLVAVSSALYLWLRDERLDRVAAASAEVGVVYTTVVLVTGPIWGKPVWGTWWTWDARLTLTLFLWFVYVGYLILRGAVEDSATRARYSAVLGILGALLIPFIHLSVYLFRTLHPMPIVLKPDAPSLPPEMLATFLMALASMTLLYLALVRTRYRLGQLMDAMDDDAVETPDEARVGERSATATLRAEPVR
ncbi:MAG TPA: cytochrome c biogenesis protein CcsA [Gemmatimonadaceae bacterium]|nr:cytochrome c biogenesis protein CcsA [Gemmatimonadaceae bacterium]